MSVDTGKMVHAAMLTAAVVAGLAFVLVMVAPMAVDVERQDAQYWGARIVPPGPGSGGLPIIPVRVADDGSLVGVPSHLQWYRYNGGQDLPGLREDYRGNDTFFASMSPERIHAAKLHGAAPWWEPLLGLALQASDFDEIGAAAPAVWRSPGGYDDHGQMHVWVMRVDPSVYPQDVREEFAPDGFIAFAARDTHFGCQVGYEMTDHPFATLDGRPLLLELCHLDRYDPLDIRRYDMPPAGSDL